MQSRILFLLKYFLFWCGIFIFQKIAFLFWNYHEAFSLHVFDWFRILWNGLKLDISTASYILFIPSLLVALSFLIPKTILKVAVNIYTYLLLFVILYLGVVDMALYSYWGFKLDITPFIYIKTPGDALASVNTGEIALLLVLFSAFFYLSLKIFRRYFHWPTQYTESRWYYIFPAGLLFSFFLIIPARGGLGIAPMNLSRVYFHQDRFANHSAINVFWNTIYSFTERKKLTETREYIDDKLAEKTVYELLRAEDKVTEKIIKPHSNLILILLESFSNKIIHSLGGDAGITPWLDTLCRQNIVFDNFYASGSRSDKGIISIFSGYPAQPTTSIIDYPAKSQKLPSIFESFSEAGYETAFYYGGDLNFANFKSYFSSPYIHKLITINDFPTEIKKQKWGICDGDLFKRLSNDLSNAKTPFFYSCFTLSSHEPFDVPMKPVFGIRSRDQLSKNGFYYTDSVLNVFIKQAKESEWWENTLVVLIADHGSRSPGNTPNHSQEKFMIPMIWTGGAVLKDTVIHKTGSQVDVPATLLSQFEMEDAAFPYSKDLLDTSVKGFAYYVFNNGFGFLDENNYVIYDCDFDRSIKFEGENPEKTLLRGKAFLQVLSEDFLSK